MYTIIPQVDITELQAEAFCALAAWCKHPDGVRQLSDEDAWLTMLQVTVISK
jgi:hypothetical protein